MSLTRHIKWGARLMCISCPHARPMYMAYIRTWECIEKLDFKRVAAGADAVVHNLNTTLCVHCIHTSTSFMTHDSNLFSYILHNFSISCMNWQSIKNIILYLWTRAQRVYAFMSNSVIEQSHEVNVHNENPHQKARKPQHSNHKHYC